MREIFDRRELGQRVPVRVWARAISSETVRQLLRLARQPYVVDFVAAMADAHLSESLAVGSVFATEHTVVPGALGGDLGCGMSAVHVSDAAHSLDRRALEDVLRQMGRAIPVGDVSHRGVGVDIPDHLLATPLSTGALQHAREALARRHLGTLGGGNHFVELDRDAEGGLWLLVHSGSRGLGAAIFAHHARVAGGPAREALAGLDTRTDEGSAYMNDLGWALAFARANRTAIATRALSVLSDVLHEPLAAGPLLDLHHNFVATETWAGRELLVHRKGAIAVPEGTLALVPGSMGTASYIVRGLGSAEAFGSCSHGAGRVMSRKEARALVRPDALARAMRGVVYPESIKERLVEEAPAAYRDIRQVLEDQEDLVTRHTRLEPLAVLKG